MSTIKVDTISNLIESSVIDVSDIARKSVDIASKVSSSTLAASGGASLVGYLPAGTGAVATNVQSKLRQSVSVWDKLSDAQRADILIASPTLDCTTAIQQCFDQAYEVIVPQGILLYSTLTIPRNRTVRGANARASILRHTGAGVGITYTDASTTEPDGTGVYIESGSVQFENIELQFNGTVGIDVGNTRSSMSGWRNVYIRHRKDLDAGDPNNQYFPGSTAIRCDNTTWISSDSTYVEEVHHVFIRGFETAIEQKATVNGWGIQGLYTIECKNQIKLDNATGCDLINCYFESGIAGARGIVFGANGGNNINLLGCTFELTNAAATQYAYDFTAAGAWSQITTIGCKYLIQGDGNAINNRRITGTPPVTFVELNRTYTSATYGEIPMLWAPSASIIKPFQLPSFSRIGGISQGNGTLLLGRNGSDAADASIANDGTYGINFNAPSSGSVVDFNWKASDGTVHLKYQGYTTPQFSPGTDNSVSLGTSTKRWSTTYTLNAKMTPVTVASLPAAATIGSGGKAFVSDATATTFASIVAGGGANPVPVYSDGTNWRIG